ncbi:MAG: 6-carboxytetrahydropterin synthase QueD [bacterium]
MRSRLTKSFTFEAAHWLPAVPTGHKCGRMHGHTYRIELALEGEVDEVFGWVIDFADVKTAFRPVLELLDHACLNDIAGLENPTAENLAYWLYQKLVSDLPLLTEVTVFETTSSSASYRS